MSEGYDNSYYKGSYFFENPYDLLDINDDI